MTKFRVDTLICDQLELEDFLNQQAQEGWELVTVIHKGTTTKTRKISTCILMINAIEMSVEAYIIIHKRKEKRWWQ